MIEMSKAQPLREEDIGAFERYAGIMLPVQYRKFLAENNGAEPEPNIFLVSDSVGHGSVRRFLRMEELLEERRLLRGVTSEALPVALAEGGNCVCIVLASGEVFYWNHEVAGQDTVLAADWTGFLETLRPFGNDDIVVRPNQIKTITFDADFLKKYSPNFEPPGIP